MPSIIAILNHKGGVGKTTTTINLAAALQQKGKKILVIDLDGQANLTESFGRSIEEPNTIYGAMKGEYPLPLIKTESGITLIPSCLDLSAAESELINEPGREMILKQLIGKLPKENKFNYILIDCPPSLGLLTLNALTAADAVIIPVQCEYFALEGISKLLNTIKIIKSKLNPSLEIEGFLLTMYDSRLRLANQIYDEVKKAFPGISLQNRHPTERQTQRSPEPRSSGYPLRHGFHRFQEPFGFGERNY